MRKMERSKFLIFVIVGMFLGAGILPSINGNQTNEITVILNENKFVYSKDKIYTTSNEIEESMDDYGRYEMIFNQQPLLPDEGQVQAYTSEKNIGLDSYKVYENLWDVNGKIDKVTWWGVCLYYDGGWIEGDPEGMNFYIDFYDDSSEKANAPPQSNIASFNVLAEDMQITHTGIYWNETAKYIEHIKFEYILPTSVELSNGEGWISIQSHDDPQGDWFLWLKSLYGDIFAYQENGEPILESDVAIQLFNYELDKIPPVVSIEQPKLNMIYLNNKELFEWPLMNPLIIGSLNITVNANDPEFVGIGYVEIIINNESKATLNNEPYNWTWDEKGVGVYRIQAKAYDKAGNYATSQEIIVIKFKLL